METKKKDQEIKQQLYLVLKATESLGHALVKVGKVLLDLHLAVLLRVLELHATELVHGVAQAVTDARPGDLVVGLRCALHGVPRQVVERADVIQHADGLVERAVAVVRRVAVLLQEVVLDQLGHFQRDLVRLGQRGFTDELDDFGQVLFFLQDLLDLQSNATRK